MKYLIIVLIFATSLASAQDLKIGWIGPLTGNSAVLGVDSLAALKMALTDNKRETTREIKISIEAEDDQYETAKSLLAYERLTKIKGVKVIFLLTYGAVFALSERAQRDGVVLIDTLDCDEQLAKLSGNIFCIAKTTEDLGAVLGQKAVDNKDLPAMILAYSSDPFMITVARSTLSVLNQQGNYSYLEEYNRGETDFRTVLLRARTKQVKSIFFYGYDEMGFAIKQAKDLGVIAQFYALNTATSQGFISGAGKGLEGTQVVTWSPQHNQRYLNFVNEFETLFKRKPDFEVSLFPTYDIGKIIFEEFLTPKSNDNSQAAVAVRERLLNLRNYQGLSGLITVDRDGACRSLKSRTFLTFKAGKFISE